MQPFGSCFEAGGYGKETWGGSTNIRQVHKLQLNPPPPPANVLSSCFCGRLCGKTSRASWAESCGRIFFFFFLVFLAEKSSFFIFLIKLFILKYAQSFTSRNELFQLRPIFFPVCHKTYVKFILCLILFFVFFQRVCGHGCVARNCTKSSDLCLFVCQNGWFSWRTVQPWSGIMSTQVSYRKPKKKKDAGLHQWIPNGVRLQWHQPINQFLRFVYVLQSEHFLQPEHADSLKNRILWVHYRGSRKETEKGL